MIRFINFILTFVLFVSCANINNQKDITFKKKKNPSPYYTNPIFEGSFTKEEKESINCIHKKDNGIDFEIKENKVVFKDLYCLIPFIASFIDKKGEVIVDNYIKENLNNSSIYEFTFRKKNKLNFTKFKEFKVESYNYLGSDSEYEEPESDSDILTIGNFFNNFSKQIDSLKQLGELIIECMNSDDCDEFEHHKVLHSKFAKTSRELVSSIYMGYSSTIQNLNDISKNQSSLKYCMLVLLREIFGACKSVDDEIYPNNKNLRVYTFPHKGNKHVIEIDKIEEQLKNSFMEIYTNLCICGFKREQTREYDLYIPEDIWKAIAKYLSDTYLEPNYYGLLLNKYKSDNSII